MNGPPKVFAGRTLIGRNLKTCQTEITRLLFCKKKEGNPLDLSMILISKVVASVFNVLFRPQASCFFDIKLKHQPV